MIGGPSTGTMTDAPRVVGICGSLRSASTTRVALGHTLAAAEAAGAVAELLDLRAYELPLYDADEKDAGEVPELRRRVREADGIVLATPIYHGSVSSVLKTALDYCGFEEFEDKPVGLLVVAGGRFPTPATLHMQTICAWVRAHPLPYQVSIPSVSGKIEDGELVDEGYRDRCETLGTELVRYTRLFRGEAVDPPRVE